MTLFALVIVSFDGVMIVPLDVTLVTTSHAAAVWRKRANKMDPR